MIKAVASSILKLSGWKVKGEVPPFRKYVLIGAPHTSNWDFVLMLAVSIHFNQKFYWMGKDTLFRWPFGKLLTMLGGIAIDRRSRNNAVQSVVDLLKKAESMVLVITPEGTRKWVHRWKTGFYHIAVGAGVPIVMGYADYKERVVGVGPGFFPTGDIESDFKDIDSFYKNISGRFREKEGVITHATPPRKTLREE